MKLFKHNGNFLLALCLLGNCLIFHQGKEFRYLKALPCYGSYSPGGLHSEYLRSLRLKQEFDIEDGYVRGDRSELPAFYLGPKQMVIEECNVGEDKCIVRGTIPVPIRSTMNDDIESALKIAMNYEKSTQYGQSWSGSVITDRNRGIFDNINIVLKKWGLLDKKKPIFEYLKVRKSATELSPYHALNTALEVHAGIKITGLLLEVADTINEVSLSLGAAVLLSKVDVATNWRLTVSNYREIVKSERTSADAIILDCYIDELLGMHLATDIPVIISKSLFDRVCIDGLLEKSGEAEDDVRLLTPYFDNTQDEEMWKRQLEASRAKPAKPVKKINEIRDATTFLRMRLSEKRACLRSSGIYALPRPREGPRKIDAIMIPLLDEEVAYEVLRRLGETRGDYQLAAKMQDFESRKPLLARLYAEARKKGDLKKARELVDELNAISTLRFDPSNPDSETPKGGFDIEEWYWEQRKRVYGIIAA